MKQEKRNKVCMWAIASFIAPFLALAVIQINRSRIVGFSLEIPLYSMLGFGFLAIIFGIIALIKIKRNIQLKGKSFAIIGIIFGALLIIFLYLLLSGWGQTEPIPLMK